MAVRIATATRNAMMDALAAKVDGGTGAGRLKVYSGTQPANANTTATGTLLVTFTLNDPAFGASAAGVITLSVSPSITATAAATGTAGWARLEDSAGNAVLDGTCGTAGSDFILDTTSVSSGQSIGLVSASTLTMPAA